MRRGRVGGGPAVQAAARPPVAAARHAEVDPRLRIVPGIGAEDGVGACWSAGAGQGQRPLVGFGSVAQGGERAARPVEEEAGPLQLRAGKRHPAVGERQAAVQGGGGGPAGRRSGRGRQLAAPRQGPSQPAGQQRRRVGASRRRRPGEAVAGGEIEAVAEHQGRRGRRGLQRGPHRLHPLEIREVEGARRDHLRARRRPSSSPSLPAAATTRIPSAARSWRTPRIGPSRPAVAPDRSPPAEAQVDGEGAVFGVRLRRFGHGAEAGEDGEVGDRRPPRRACAGRGEIVEFDAGGHRTRGFADRRRHAPPMIRRPVEDGDPGRPRGVAETAPVDAGECGRQGGYRLVGDRQRRRRAAVDGKAGGLVGDLRTAEDERARASAGDDPHVLVPAGVDPAVRRQPAPRHRRLRTAGRGLDLRPRRGSRKNDRAAAQGPGAREVRSHLAPLLRRRLVRQSRVRTSVSG